MSLADGYVEIYTIEDFDLIPTELVYGEALKLKFNLIEYPDPTFEINMKINTADTNEDVAVAAAGGIFIYDFDTSDYVYNTTTNLLNYQVYAVHATQNWMKILYTGAIYIHPDIGTGGSPDADLRSHAVIALSSIEAVIENRATKDQLEYSIAGRSLKLMSIDDLLKFRNYYKAEVSREQQAAANAVGGNRSNFIWAKLSRNY